LRPCVGSFKPERGSFRSPIDRAKGSVENETWGTGHFNNAEFVNMDFHLYAQPAALAVDLASQAPTLPSYGGLLGGRMGLLGTYLGMWRRWSVSFGELSGFENVRDVGKTMRWEKSYSRRKLSVTAKRPQCTR
jgi:hypothetical protein